jgi:hypothetical protein
VLSEQAHGLVIGVSESEKRCKGAYALVPISTRIQDQQEISPGFARAAHDLAGSSHDSHQPLGGEEAPFKQTAQGISVHVCEVYTPAYKYTIK